MWHSNGVMTLSLRKATRWKWATLSWLVGDTQWMEKTELSDKNNPFWKDQTGRFSHTEATDAMAKGYWQWSEKQDGYSIEGTIDITSTLWDHCN